MLAARFLLKVVLLGFVLVVVGACVTGQEDRQTASSFYMGCYPSEIIVSGVMNDQSGVSSWQAQCRGRTYNCAAVGTDEAPTCRPALRQTG
jgi:hypothetical protein